MLVHLFDKEWESEADTWKHMKLANLHVPSLLAGFEKINAAFNWIVSTEMPLAPLVFQTKTEKVFTGHEWDAQKVLEYIFCPVLQQLVHDENNLVLILKMDAFPLGGHSAFAATLTLYNFNYDLVHYFLGNNLAWFERISAIFKFTLKL
ncbi:hypothetical protein QOT17_008185 [Balamuthia mandrillaris]